MTYDLIIFCSLLVCIWIPVTFLKQYINNEYIYDAFRYLCIILISFGYFAGFWKLGNQTVGMRIWKVYLINEDNVKKTNIEKLNWKQVSIRFIIAIIGIIPLCGLSYVLALIKKDRTMLHDTLSGTRLIFHSNQP